MLNKNVNKSKNKAPACCGRQNSKNYREYMMKKAAIYKIVVFLAMLCIGACISLLLPLRPAVSENEKRTLTAFPDFNIKDFMNGSYFSQIDTWFADTFPFRDDLMLYSEQFTSLYGIRKQVVHGGVVAGDNIPDVGIDADALNQLVGQGDNQENQNGQEEHSEENHQTGNTAELPLMNVEDIGTNVEGTDGTTAAQAGERLGSIFVVGDSAYNYYAFSQIYSDLYVETVNKLADSLQGKAALYDMVVPTSIDIALDDATRNSLTSSNQKKAILYMYSRMNSNVQKTYVYDLLKSRRNEYLYFRTDHHWTALGAYYAYSVFIKQLGKTPTPLEAYEELIFDNFKGSFFTQSGVVSLGNNPDTVYAYKPLATNHLRFIDHEGTLVDYNIITDVSSWNPTSKYNAFIGGDNAYTVISNPQLQDGSSCLVVKESFGNAFVPYLIDHFQNVYVVDYRYYDGTVSALVEEYGIDTVIVINNITATSTQQRVKELQRVCQ